MSQLKVQLNPNLHTNMYILVSSYKNVYTAESFSMQIHMDENQEKAGIYKRWRDEFMYIQGTEGQVHVYAREGQVHVYTREGLVKP